MKAKSLAPPMKVGYDLFNQLSINQTVRKNKYSDRNSTVIDNYRCSHYKDTAERFEYWCKKLSMFQIAIGPEGL